jgi:O-antigen/teichoic acid export membrane protein
VTTRNFPSALTGLAANIVLIVLLVPPLGIAGAGIALCGAYVVMLGVMHALTRRAFAAQFEWRRLVQLCLVMGGVSALGDVLLPTAGLVGFVTRVAALLAVPLILIFTGFFHAQERRQVRALLARVRLNASPVEGR